MIPIYSWLIFSIAGSVLVSEREQLPLLPEPRVRKPERSLSRAWAEPRHPEYALSQPAHHSAGLILASCVLRLTFLAGFILGICFYSLIRFLPGLILDPQWRPYPNGAKTQLLMHTNPNYLLDLCILLGLFDRAYQLMVWKVCIYLIKYWSPLREQGSFQGSYRSQG